MAPQYSEEELIEAYEVYKAAGSFRKAAKELGIDRLTVSKRVKQFEETVNSCLLYTSPSPRDRTRSRMPSSA